MNRRAAALLLLCATLAPAPVVRAAEGDSFARQVASGTPAVLVDLGLPHVARDAWKALPASTRATDGSLSAIVMGLSDIGDDEAAMELARIAADTLGEPVRSDAWAALGAIHWRRMEFDQAETAYRHIFPSSPHYPAAAERLARIRAAKGDSSATALLADLPASPRKEIVAAQVDAALRGTPYISTQTPSQPDSDAPHPEALARRSASAAAHLAGGRHTDALAEAEKGIATAGALAATLDVTSLWDGTAGGARDAIDPISSRLPPNAESRRLEAAGRRFLALSALSGTARVTGNEARALERRALAIRSVIDERLAAINAAEARVSLLGKRGAELGRATGSLRDRLVPAAEGVLVQAFGASIDPEGADRLAKVVTAQKAVSERVDALRKSAEMEPEGARTDTKLMLLFLRNRLDRTGREVAALSDRAAVLRAKVFAEWKEKYAARVSETMDGIDAVAERAAGIARSAEVQARPLIDARDTLRPWTDVADATARRAARTLDEAEKDRSAAVSAANGSLADARVAVGMAIAAETRRLHYLAGRALVALRDASAPDNASVRQSEAIAAERGRLRDLAIRHFDSALPPTPEAGVPTDEVVFALADLSFDASEALFLEKEGGALPDFSKSSRLYARIIREFPASPYIEPALYGLALCQQEGGDADNAVVTLATLLAKHPSTRYADEVRLRLGEYAFDRYDFKEAEDWYRQVSDRAPSELKTTALFKMGWSLFLTERPSEAVFAFRDALALSPGARRTGGLKAESLNMVARMLVEAGTDNSAETFLAEKNLSEHGPALLLRLQQILSSQNRHADSARIADRMAVAYPLAAERLDVELAAIAEWRKEQKEDLALARRGALYKAIGPKSPWQGSPDRTQEQLAKADNTSEEGLRAWAFDIHGAIREGRRTDRDLLLSRYDDHLTLFPGVAKREEVSYQRAFLLFEMDRKNEAKTSFETVSAMNGARGEAAGYMAVQAAKDLLVPGDAGSLAEVIRLCREYEKANPEGERKGSVLLDRAKAHAGLKEHVEAADAADAAVARKLTDADRKASLHISGDARFESGDFVRAEKGFRGALALAPEGEVPEIRKWVAFSIFRQAEGALPGNAKQAGVLFLKVTEEFPEQEAAPIARFRAAAAFEVGGAPAEAIRSYLVAEKESRDKAMALDSTRRLCVLYEKTGEPMVAAERHERLSTDPAVGPEEQRGRLLKAVELYASAKESARFRSALLAFVARPDAPAEGKVSSLFRVAESFRADGAAADADRYYADTVKTHAETGALPAIAGKALFLRAEPLFATLTAMRIDPPLEESFPRKQAALAACANIYVEAVKIGDIETVSASLHRIGEAFEDFKTSILSSPPPNGLSDLEREEYAFLLDERAGPIEEQAVEAYINNLRQAVAADFTSPWVMKTLVRLQAIRPARFAKPTAWAFPVVAVPEFHGIVERSQP